MTLTFGGMWRWRRVAVARVFALVVRCRIMLLLLYSRVGKNRDTRRGSPAGAGAACAASHITNLLSQKILAAQKPMTYTDLLCSVVFYFRSIYLFNFSLISPLVNPSHLSIIVSCGFIKMYVGIPEIT